MTDVVFLSQLPPAAAVTAADIVPITQGSTGTSTGTTRRATMAQVAAAVQGIAPPLAVGTTAGTVAAGNDARITGALAATTAASTYAPLTAILAVGTTAGTVAAGNDARITGALAATTAASTYAPLTALATKQNASDRVNVIARGIDATGATDQTSALQTLSSSLPTSGATMWFPAGTYKILSPWYVAENVTLEIDSGAVFPNALNSNTDADGSVLSFQQGGKTFQKTSGNDKNSWAFFSSIVASPPAGAGTNHEKAAIYAASGSYGASVYNITTSYDYATTFRDIVGLQASGTILGATQLGRAWGATVGASTSTTSDGTLCGLEVDLINYGVAQGENNRKTSKNGINVVNMGPNAATTGFTITNAGGTFFDGVSIQKNSVSRYAYVVRDLSVYPSTAPFSVDPSGNTVVASLTIAGAAMSPYAQVNLFGTGADGSVTLGGGTTTLTRDMHYTNLTINGTGKIDPGGYRIYVSNVLDLSVAGAGAIAPAGYGPGTSVGSSAGVSPFVYWGVTVGGARWGGNGPAGTTGVGGAGSGSVVFPGYAPPVLGGDAGAGGTGGAGVAGAGGAGGAANAVTGRTQYFANTLGLINAISAALSDSRLSSMGSGSAGSSGGSGAGDGTNAGGGSGSGGSSNPVVQIFARFIQRGANTTAGVIANKSGVGGGGGNAPAGNAGGGGGGSGAGGGGVYIMAESLLGSVIPNAINVSGGAGGAGGNGVGTGKGGNGGTGGNAGSYQTLILSPATFFASAFTTVGSAGGTTATATGAAGGSGGILQGDF